MRTTLLFSILLSAALCAQTTFAPIGATWTYRTGYGLSSPWPIPYGQYTVWVSGDTVVNETICSIVHFPIGTDCGFPDGMTTQRDIYTCVRSDSVFWYNELSGQFDLIMDYGAAIGDEWRIPLRYDNWGEWLHDTATYHVWSIDTLWYAGEPLRRLHYSTELTTGVFQGGSTESVERLGDTRYMIPWRTCSDGIFEDPLLCYSEPGFSWPDPSVNCAIWLGMVDHGDSSSINISPSVLQHGQVATFDIGTDHRSGQLEVFDPIGRRIVDRTFQGSTDLIFQTAGLHIVRFSNGGSNPQVRRVMVH